MCWFEVLQADVEGPLPLQARELACKASDWWVYEVGFIREKGKDTARAVQQSLESGSSLLRWRLGFLMDILTLGLGKG
jgi:hypothetical protein